MVQFKSEKLARIAATGISALALSASMFLVGCGGGAATTEQPAAETTTTEATAEAPAAADPDFDANGFYVGQWRGSVEITGETVYGAAGGNEQMLDVNFADDGTVEVVPVAAHADLLTDTGTWEGTKDQVTLHLSGGDIVLSVSGSASLTGDAHAFDIADFDTINFDFYG